MAQEYKLKGLTSLDLKDGQMKEVEVEGIEKGKVLLVNTQGKTHAISSNCTHYGAPLMKGVLSEGGRLTCAWHGACFNVATGDVEDAPALDPLAKFDLVEKDGAVYIKGEESTIKASRKKLDISCKVSGNENVVIIGGGSGTVGAMEGLRGGGFKGQITVISSEGYLPIDRTRLSKALMTDESKAAWRTPEFYKSASIDMIDDEVTNVDFESKSITTKSGRSLSYTKLILATGGSPNSLPLDGLKPGELENVFLLRTLKHTQAINSALGEDSPKKVVIIGSSFIGLEVAKCLVGMKHDVTVVGMESAPVETVFGPELGNIIRALLEKEGVKFHMKAQVSHASPSKSDKSKVGAVHLKDGTEYPAEIVIEGVGVKPATNFLKESKGAPSLNKDGSLTVDDTFAVTGLKDVFAIGDIATYPYKGHQVRIEHWNVAQNAGRTVAKAINQPNAKQKPFVPIFWSALGMQLRYCGHAGPMTGGYDDVIFKGETKDLDKLSFAAYFVKGDDVQAVATMGKDPVMSQCSELMRRGKMLGRKDIESGMDVLAVPLPASL